LPGDRISSCRERADLCVRGLSVGYGGDPIVRDVHVDAGISEIVAIIGPNGSGKSTLVKAIAGVLRPSAGSVRWEGAEVTDERPDRLARIGLGYVPQSRDVFEGLSVRENLEMGGYLLRQNQLAERIDRVISRFPSLGALMRRQVESLSGGERKMVAVGRVLMTEPKVLILDEPTAGLAPAAARPLLQDHLVNLAKSGTAILIVEQRASEVLQIADWGYVLVSGEVQATGSGRGLLERSDIAEMFLGLTKISAVADREHAVEMDS
jgi:branched-chain amino acid transport system ATP-binding protein